MRLVTCGTGWLMSIIWHKERRESSNSLRRRILNMPCPHLPGQQQQRWTHRESWLARGRFPTASTVFSLHSKPGTCLSIHRSCLRAQTTSVQYTGERQRFRYRGRAVADQLNRAAASLTSYQRNPDRRAARRICVRILCDPGKNNLLGTMNHRSLNIDSSPCEFVMPSMEMPRHSYGNIGMDLENAFHGERTDQDTESRVNHTSRDDHLEAVR